MPTDEFMLRKYGLTLGGLVASIPFIFHAEKKGRVSSRPFFSVRYYGRYVYLRIKQMIYPHLGQISHKLTAGFLVFITVKYPASKFHFL